MSGSPKDHEPTTTKTSWDLVDQLRPASSAERTTSELKHKPYFKDHFPAVVAYVYLSRYVTKDHVFRRFPNIYNSERTCSGHLRQLVSLGHLTTVSVQSAGVSFPHVYITTRKGISLIKRHFEWDIPYSREESVVLPSVMHELLLTDFQLECHLAIERRGDLTIKGRTERRYFLKHKQLTFVTQGTQQHLIPDAGFLLAQMKTPAESQLLLHLIEMDMGTENLLTVLKKFRTYDDWWHADDGTKYLTELYHTYGRTKPHPTFRLLVVVCDSRKSKAGGDERRLINLYNKSLDLPADTRNLLWFTTVDAIREARSESDLPLTQPIWRRGQQAHSWIDDYRTFSAALRRGPGQKPEQHKRQYVSLKLKQMKPVALLPKPPVSSDQTQSGP